MIVDSHVHLFPYLGDASGFASETEHRQFLQLYMATHGEPVRRLNDHAHVTRPTLYTGDLTSLDCLTSVNFRVGRFGRFEWTIDSEDVYIQYFPPSLQSMESPAEFILQQMARAGVDRAVLQNARPYGRLNTYLSDAVQRYPGRFIALADVDESNAHTRGEIDRLRYAIRDLGLRGLYYANRALITSGYTHMFDDAIFDPFWEEVRGLGIPVFWEIFGAPDPNSTSDLLREVERLNRWLGRWPSIPAVWTHGFPPELLWDMPTALEELLRHDQLSVEILYPIYWARTHEYPFAELRPALETLYRRVGGERLLWGSDMPNVERNCTYRQSLEYLRIVSSGWLPAIELDRILGLNVLNLLGWR